MNGSEEVREMLGSIPELWGKAGPINLPDAAFNAIAAKFTKALEDARGVAQAPSWQQIETAPKDGTKVDLLYAYPRGRQNDCQWRQGDVYGEGGWYWSIPQWGSQPGLGIDWHLLPEDEWETGCYPNMEPTHWMLPPALPGPVVPSTPRHTLADQYEAQAAVPPADRQTP